MSYHSVTDPIRIADKSVSRIRCPLVASIAAHISSTASTMGFLRLLVALALHLTAVAATDIPAPGTVYFVIGSDTAIWNWPGGINILEPTNHFTTELYTAPQSRAYKVMDPAFRASIKDSFGATLKMTWWMMVGSVYGASDNYNVPVPNLMPLHLMRRYHGDSLQFLGDELTLHYHTFLWSDYNGDGKYYWNQARTFHECRADFDRTLAQALIEEETFTVTFRSGWHYMDNEWQEYCNELWPYNMDNDSPIRSSSRIEPLYNQIDWSLAPLDFVPYHPAPTNYQVPGDSPGWNVRSVKMPNVNSALVERIFAAAASGTNQVVSFWAHLPETDFLDQVTRMNQLIHAASSNQPTVTFRYCTSIEAMQRWRGTTDTQPPRLEIGESIQDDTTLLHLKTDEPIYQHQPFVALKDISGNYRILSCQPEGSNGWTVPIPLSRRSVSKLGIAVTDPAGNLTTRVLRWRPDEQFVDNRDAGYTEPSGHWTNTSAAAWGVDARIARLTPGTSATAQWVLPVQQSGVYAIALQIPPITNRTSHLQVQVSTGTHTAVIRELGSSIATSRWLPILVTDLESAATNTLLISGIGDTNAFSFATADVVRISPAISEPITLANVHTEPGATTANILWTTDQPCPDWVEFGRDLRYGRISRTNLTWVTNHVATLSGLAPGTDYQFQIVCRRDGIDITRQGEFSTTSEELSSPVPILDAVGFDQIWHYSTDNLDGTPWMQPSFIDAAWKSGPGILWVDARTTGPNPSIQPLGEKIPLNPQSGFPYSTYYFRTHFTVPSPLAVTSVLLTNYLDDGAVFYIDGKEIQRINLSAAPAPVTNAQLATGYNCGGDATCPVAFISAISLLPGDHVLAAEVHNYNKGSPDITFGCTLTGRAASTAKGSLGACVSGTALTLYWNGTGWILQEAPPGSEPTPRWNDVSPEGAVSPWFTEMAGSRLFRLRHP